MLFTTIPFMLLFLPVVLAGFFALGRKSASSAASWLFLASLFFYGFWMPEYVALLIGSMALNFGIGVRLARAGADSPARKAWLATGVALNLLVLGYFKYANFFANNINALLATDWNLAEVVLPIGISFYSFTQIAFLVDTYRQKVQELNPVHYGLFVTYFPHLIAGPVLHHAQMMPQFARAETYRLQGANLSLGAAIFCIGLFKKVVLADGIAPYADTVFNAAEAGSLPSTPEAWLAAIAYSLQLYFDFSGYSDMAIGISWMFNVRLPFNFDSPYKSRSISEFWRRWHISLSTFLRDYLYFALGGNRHGAVRRYANLMATMVLGGLWHGASWSFVAWGALHGTFLMLNHGFRAICGPGLVAKLEGNRAFGWLAWVLTLACVVLAWVLFRAQSFSSALNILQAMFGLASANPAPLLHNAGLHAATGAVWCCTLGAIALFAPNSNRLGDQLRNVLNRFGSLGWLMGSLAICTALFLLLVNTARDAVSAFIYFNF